MAVPPSAEMATAEPNSSEPDPAERLAPGVDVLVHDPSEAARKMSAAPTDPFES
jgi:hypothetical protein